MSDLERSAVLRSSTIRPWPSLLGRATRLLTAVRAASQKRPGLVDATFRLLTRTRAPGNAGAPGERNEVHVTRREHTLIVTDPGATIATRTGTCAGRGHVATCALPAPEPVSPVVIDGGDGDDRLDTSAMPSEARLDGGPGNDVLVSGTPRRPGDRRARR